MMKTIAAACRIRISASCTVKDARTPSDTLHEQVREHDHRQPGCKGEDRRNDHRITGTRRDREEHTKEEDRRERAEREAKTMPGRNAPGYPIPARRQGEAGGESCKPVPAGQPVGMNDIQQEKPAQNQERPGQQPASI